MVAFELDLIADLLAVSCEHAFQVTILSLPDLFPQKLNDLSFLARFVITWSLIVALVGAYQPAASYNEEAITLGNLVPYEKFVEGDVIEPLL